MRRKPCLKLRRKPYLITSWRLPFLYCPVAISAPYWSVKDVRSGACAVHENGNGIVSERRDRTLLARSAPALRALLLGS